MRRTMTVLAATATMMGCGPSVVVQGFGAIDGPSCTVDDSSPLLSRGILDLAATDRYQAFLKARTGRDVDVLVVEAEVDLSLRMTAEEVELFATAASQINGGSGIDCAGVECRTTVPRLTPAVSAELGLIDDERVLVVSTDIIQAEVGAALAAIMETARDIDPSLPLTDIEATVNVTLIDQGGSRSLPATFIIDLCRGCLAPTDSICSELNATANSLPFEACLPGQDLMTSTCVCSDGATAPADGCDI